MRAQFSSIAAGQWLSIRLSIIAVSIVAAIAVSAVIQHQITGVDSGLVALAITYALSLTSLLNGLLGSFIETEKEMVSVERIDDYLTNVQLEDDSGEGVSLRYNSYLPLALDNINLSINAGEKVAIVGRTGSGKSSIFQALLRMISIESGKILLDGVPNFIDSSACVTAGSLFENLIVGCEHVDTSQVATIARVAHLDTLMTRIGGLDGLIDEGGKNLSFGERQIISICRVLLAKCKVVLIDEATSHLDETVHRRMMSLISVHLPMATVICITHVLHGLSEFDTVIEMANGKVLRQGPPMEPISHEIRS
ncbi:ABC transporter, ATP-binding protein [Cooperia oncophora]